MSVSVCLSVCPQGLYFRTLSNGRYILKHSIPPGKFSHIIHPRHRAIVPYRKRTIPYTVFFSVPYRENIPYQIRCFPHIPIYHTTNISHIPYRVRQSELGRRLYTRSGACYCHGAVYLCKGGDEYRVCVGRAPLFARPKKASQSWLRRLDPTLGAAHWPLVCTTQIKNISYEYYTAVSVSNGKTCFFSGLGGYRRTAPASSFPLEHESTSFLRARHLP